jgi:Tfp pilus assembly protein PilO
MKIDLKIDLQKTINNLFEAHKSLILNLAFILLSLFIANKLLKSQLKEIDALKAKKETEFKRSGVIITISSMEKKVAAYKILLPRKDPSSLINTVTTVAKESGVKIESIRPVQEQKFDDYTKVPFSVLLLAPSYNSLGRFISKIENHQDFLMVDSLNIKLQSQARELDVDLSLSNIFTTN